MNTPDQDLEILVFGEGMGDEPHNMQFPAHTSVRDVITFAIARGLPATTIEEVVVFIENGDRELEMDAVLLEVGIGHHHRLHCHRCRKIETVISAKGGAHLHHKFSPATTGRHVREWVAKELDQPEVRFALYTEDKVHITDGRHIGSLLHGDTCELPLVLADTEGKSGYLVKVYNEDNGRPIYLYGTVETPIRTLIEEMYHRFGIARQPDDRLRCECPAEDVFTFEALTLGDYVCSGHCKELVWLFAGGTGGA